MSTILVTGGTGTLGSVVAAQLEERGHEVRVLSRHSKPYAVDLQTGVGLDRAMEGCDVVVHCASRPKGGDERAAQHVVEAARRYKVAHLVYISIVGVDQVPLAYYNAKFAVEQRIEQSGLGYTILRATQFHELVLSILEGTARLPVMLLPSGVKDQPVEVTEVATRLVELAAGEPQGRVDDMAGPEVLTFAELAEQYLKASGRSRKVIQVPLAGKTFAALRSGRHLAPEHAVGKGTFRDFLARRFPGAS